MQIVQASATYPAAAISGRSGGSAGPVCGDGLGGGQMDG
jgi:hypothetical protein